MAPAPDNSSYTWGLAMIALALVVALMGALANRVQAPQGTAAAAAVISDPMGLAMSELHDLDACNTTSLGSPPTD